MTLAKNPRIKQFWCTSASPPRESYHDIRHEEVGKLDIVMFQDYIDYIGMSEKGHEYLKTLDTENLLSAEEAAAGVIKVIGTVLQFTIQSLRK